MAHRGTECRDAVAETVARLTATGCRDHDRPALTYRAIARNGAARSDAGWLQSITLPSCPAATAKPSRKSFRSRGR
jgi:hypothetical protein